jgi:diguanylate cyclase (GGDEF)-like protein
MDEESKKEELLQRIAYLEAHVRDLESDLIHDPLTTLKTRAFFQEETNIYLSAIATIETSKRKEWFGFRNLSVLFFDVDYFKKINDTYGHATGDFVLQKIARTIAESMRQGDTVARWGGEEIVASLLGANETNAKEKAEEIRKKIEELKFENDDMKFTVSIGVASSFGRLSCDDLVNRADEAVYKAKETGRNKVVAYSELAN